MAEWSDIAGRDPIYLNLGGAEYHHPRAGYEHYVSVDLDAPPGAWTVRHDLTQPVPLPDGSVSRIHTEDFLEHLSIPHIDSLLVECHRLLRHDGHMRIGVPDYNNPKDRRYLRVGRDDRYPGHVTLTTHAIMKDIVERSPFPRHRFYHYWDGDVFVQHDMDYTKGMIWRTPDNHPRCRRQGTVEHVKGAVRDLAFVVSRGFKVSDAERLSRKGRRFYVTSLTVDLFMR